MRSTALRLSLLVMIAAVATLGPSLAQEAPKGLDVSEYNLENGLKLIVVNRPGVPIVSSYVYYNVGSADEVPTKSGMAHFLEHMMFKGSRNYKKGEIDQICARNGGSNNAATSNDFTRYFINLPKSRYVEALKIEADRMRDLTLDGAEFDAEKKVVQSESDINADNPGAQLWERMEAVLFSDGHPYAHPTLGWPQDVQDTSRRDMREFYDRWYRPDNATIVLAGDITGDEAFPIIKELFGKIPRGPDVMRTTTWASSFKGPASIEQKGDSEVLQMIRMYGAVKCKTPDDYPLDVLGMIMGDGITSRLYRKLVDELKIADGVSAGNYSQKLAGCVYVEAQLASGAKREDLEAAVDKTIAEICDSGVTPAELERVKNRMAARAVFERESADDLAGNLGLNQSIFGDWRLAVKYTDFIKAVTAADVQRVAKKYLVADSRVTGWLVPQLTPPKGAGATADAKPEPLKVVREVLDNGMTVLLYERPGLPIVDVAVDVRTGKVTDPAEKPGVASLAGALMDAGTAKYTKQQIAEMMEDVGGQLSVGSAGASVHVLTPDVELGLELMADSMQNPAFVPVEFELAKRQTLASIEASKEETQGFARDAAVAWLYGSGTPLGRPGIGTKESVEKITRDDLVAWHKKWYRPDNAILAAVGDFKAADMLKLIKAKFSGWKTEGARTQHPAIKAENRVGLKGTQAFNFTDFDYAKVDGKTKRVTIDHPEKDQVVVRLQCVGIKRDNPDYYALVVMDSVFGTSPGFTDRFSKRLRDEMGLAYSTYANIASGSSFYEGSFIGYIGTRPENVELALKEMYRLIDEIRTKPVSEKELRDAKDYLKGSFVFGLETSGQLAGLLTAIERYNLGFDYLVKYAESIEKVTIADIQRVATRYLEPETMVEVLCGPIAKITPAPKDDREPK
ncbi:MAG: insulinase family protein [Planctomycetes bacterium]|nr:insulinase family protein [Planctomycetota bacterium]